MPDRSVHYNEDKKYLVAFVAEVTGDSALAAIQAKEEEVIADVAIALAFNVSDEQLLARINVAPDMKYLRVKEGKVVLNEYYWEVMLKRQPRPSEIVMAHLYANGR